MIVDEAALTWEHAPVSEHEASRGRCRACGTVVFWDAPGRGTVSLDVTTLADASGLEVAALIWVGDGAEARVPGSDVPVFGEGLPASVVVPWRG